MLGLMASVRIERIFAFWQNARLYHHYCLFIAIENPALLDIAQRRIKLGHR